ncbi:MAG TPA: hemolysin family protein [Anaeromyxobacteraceae bacterium]|nr:hemolysin family protein [Anaeromyxobacteraceae bacterium]
MDAEVPSWQWFWGFVFVLGSAFLAAAETALNTLGERRARLLVEGGGPVAKLLSIWIKHPERVRATLTVGSTICSVGLGALAVHVAVSFGLSPIALRTTAVAALLAVVALLVVGQLVPRVLGRRFPATTAVLAIPVVHVLHWLLWPAAVGVERGSRFFAARLGNGEPEQALTSDEIEYLIERGARQGAIDAVREELLSSVLEFADRVVREIMVPRTRMVAIDRDAPPEEILRIVTENPYSRMPVYRGSVDEVLGILLVRALIPELARSSRTLPQLEKHLLAPLFVPEQMKISKLLREMQRRKIHMAVVVDEFGGTSGIVTLEDVIEEIVGEIQDEADTEAAPIRPIGEAAWLADGSISLRDLEEYLNGLAPVEDEARIEFPENGDYETLAGFVTATAGRVPSTGARVDWDGLTFTVRAADERRVTKVEIARRRENPGEGEGAPALVRAAQQGT